MASKSVLSTILGWLRAGYPDGVPERDYVPLFALLGSKLSEEDVNAVAEALASSGTPESAQAIHDAIAAVTRSRPLDVDIARVRARLAAGGWPLAGPEQLPH